MSRRIEDRHRTKLGDGLAGQQLADVGISPASGAQHGGTEARELPDRFSPMIRSTHTHLEVTDRLHRDSNGIGRKIRQRHFFNVDDPDRVPSAPAATHRSTASRRTSSMASALGMSSNFTIRSTCPPT